MASPKSSSGTGKSKSTATKSPQDYSLDDDASTLNDAASVRSTSTTSTLKPLLGLKKGSRSDDAQAQKQIEKNRKKEERRKDAAAMAASTFVGMR